MFFIAFPSELLRVTKPGGGRGSAKAPNRPVGGSHQTIPGMPPNHCMQPTPQPVIKFAYANLPPVWCAADAGC